MVTKVNQFLIFLQIIFYCDFFVLFVSCFLYFCKTVKQSNELSCVLINFQIQFLFVKLSNITGGNLLLSQAVK